MVNGYSSRFKIFRKGNYWLEAYTSGSVNTSSPQGSANSNAGPGGSLGKRAVDVISSNDIIPEKFKLEQNFPNPFNPSTKIRFHLPEEAIVTITIYDTLGHVVKTLAFTSSYQSGIHSLTWNGKNESGDNLSSGVYFYRIKAIPKSGSHIFSDSRKLVYIR